MLITVSDEPPVGRWDISRYTPRQQAWIVLADLFRSTETTPSEVSFIAGHLRQLGFDAATAERIFSDEVAPVFGWNTYSVTPEWMGWNDDSIVEEITSWLARRDRPGLRGALYRATAAARFRKWFFTRGVVHNWQRVANALDAAGAP
ncbi:MAG: hypothetical protein KGQ77_10320 [Betaproteobacteria bacterium]|nr:hypothetical protein [Betaproteobacteria bacterium]